MEKHKMDKAAPASYHKQIAPLQKKHYCFRCLLSILFFTVIVWANEIYQCRFILFWSVLLH